MCSVNSVGIDTKSPHTRFSSRINCKSINLSCELGTTTRPPVDSSLSVKATKPCTEQRSGFLNGF
jgi:hypothetical protein